MCTQRAYGMRKYERAATRCSCQTPPPPSRQGPARQIVMTAKYFRPHYIIRDCYLYATSRKVVGSITDGVIGIFHWHNPSGRTLAVWSTQPLTEMSTRNISWGGKGGRCIRLTTLPPSCADCLEIWEPQPPWKIRACPGLKWDCFAFLSFFFFFFLPFTFALFLRQITD